MKKFAKTNSRKGFTLVETLLAVFILIVVSTMLINGFITTMAYSYQTSVYTKSGANNYKACMNTLSKWNHYENLGDDGREAGHRDSYGVNPIMTIYGKDADKVYFYYAVDERTGVVYIMGGAYNRGYMSTALNADGTPMLKEQLKEMMMDDRE